MPPQSVRTITKGMVLLHQHTHQLQINIKEVWPRGFQRHSGKAQGVQKHYEIQKILLLVLRKSASQGT